MGNLIKAIIALFITMLIAVLSGRISRLHQELHITRIEAKQWKRSALRSTQSSMRVSQRKSSGTT